MGVISGSHDPKSMDKWVTPRTMYSIKNAETILAILQNSMMTKPIDELGLKPETVAALKTKFPNILFGAQLAVLSSNKIWGFERNISDDIFEVLKQNQLEADSLSEQTTSYFGLIISPWSRTEDSKSLEEGLQKAIGHAKELLEKYNAERAEELSKLYFVKIELPQTLNLLNRPQTITRTAQDYLHVAFSSAVDGVCKDLVSKDVSTIRDGANQASEGWYDRLMDKVSAFLRKPTPPAKAGRNGVECFSLEFAVSANLDGESDRLKMLAPIFAEVALALAGTTLTANICKRLSPNYSEPHNPPQGHDWINVQTPYEQRPL